MKQKIIKLFLLFSVIGLLHMPIQVQAYELKIQTNDHIKEKIVIKKEYEDIIDLIIKNYPDITEERILAIRKAFYYVDNSVYDKKSHMKLLSINDPISGNISTDCSGFVSNIWYEKQKGEILTTSLYKSKYQDIWQKFDKDLIQPGDILLHYSDEGGHALIYLGYIYDKEDIIYYSIDCSTTKTETGALFRSRGNKYYQECYFINADLL